MKLFFNQFKFVTKSRRLNSKTWAKYYDLKKKLARKEPITDQDKFFMRHFRAALKPQELKVIATHKSTNVASETILSSVTADAASKKFSVPYKQIMTDLLKKVRDERKKKTFLNTQSKQFEGAQYKTIGGVMEKPKLINEIAKRTTMNDPYSTKQPRMKSKNYIGIELEFNQRIGVDQRMIADALSKAKLAKYVSVTTDSSCGWEVRVLVSEDDFIEPLTKIMEVLKDLGHSADTRCGAHVHFDMRNRDIKLVYENLFKTQRFLRKLIKKTRKFNARFCKMNKAETFDKQLSLGDRYYALNVQSYSKHKTLEVRMFQGTLNPDELIPWIKLLLKVVNYKTGVLVKVNTLKQARKQFELEETLSKNLQTNILTLFRTPPSQGVASNV
jgi:hypothetical protein